MTAPSSSARRNPAHSRERSPGAPTLQSARAWRLSIVLGELRYPAQKWMILTAAESYGADVQTRIELDGLPEATYQDIDGVIATVDNRAALAARA